MLSIVIPAFNEELSIRSTVSEISNELKSEDIEHEVIVVDDNSSDNTLKVLEGIQQENSQLRIVRNFAENGFGNAVICGISNVKGEYVAIMMADLSDSPKDLVKFYKKILEGYDCVFGSRFIKNGEVYDYPKFKLVLNRFFNLVIKLMFNIKYNDVTNAFKMYRKDTLDGLKPYMSPHFNLTVELPLKAIVRGYSYAILPNSWKNRKFGESKLKIKEMGSRYFFILLYCLIEKYFSRGDYLKK